MSVKYRKVQREILNGPDKGQVKTYGIAKASYRCDLLKLCNLVSSRTAMSASEVKGIIDAFLWAMDMELLSGATVAMGDFGSFRISIRTEGTQTPEEFKGHHIKGARIIFTPGVQLKASVSRIHFEADDVKEVIITEECTEPHA